MQKRSQEDNVFYDEYEKSLALMIYEKSKGEIPLEMSKNLAKNAVRRRRYDVSRGKTKSMEEYAEDCIWAYFQ